MNHTLIVIISLFSLTLFSALPPGYGYVVAPTNTTIDGLISQTTSPVYKPTSDFISSTTTTVVVTPFTEIYRVSVTNSTTITFDLTALDTNKTSKWETWIDYGNTNSSISWDSRLSWGYNLPIFNVTGRYKFMCDMEGTNITIKQTYPTVFNWEGIPAYQPTSVANLNAILYSNTILTNSIGFSAWTVPSPLLVRFNTTAVNASSIGIYTNLVGVYLTSSAQGGAAYNFGYVSYKYTALNFSHYPATMYIVLPSILTPRSYILYLRFEFTNIGGSSGAGILAQGMLERRPLNELEAAAWSATGFVPMN